jgi:hypothetical protein
MAKAQSSCQEQLQRTTVDTYLRLCLMTLARPFALHPDGPAQYPEAYWSSLECSLALLMHCRELWNFGSPQQHSTADGLILRYDLVGGTFIHDFFSAHLTASLHVFRHDAPLNLGMQSSVESQIPPRQIILETLHSCIEITIPETERSICWKTAHEMLSAVVALLPTT